MSRSGLAVAYGYKNISYQGPIIAAISFAPDSSKVNVTYSAAVSPSIELRNPNGFEVKFIDFSLPMKFLYVSHYRYVVWVMTLVS